MKGSIMSHPWESRPEYLVDVPRMYVDASGADEKDVTIEIAAVGGGTVGESYAFNKWFYAVREDGQLVISGADIHSGATGATHADTARTLANFLTDAGDRLYSDSMGRNVEDIDALKDEYDAPAQKFLIQNNQRFGRVNAEAGDD